MSAAGAPVPIRVDARVALNRCEGGSNHRIRLEVPNWPGCEPGQFAMLSAGARASVPRFDPLLPRPMAIYREGGAPGEIEVLYKVSGRGTALLAEAVRGDLVGVVGPLGRPFPLPGGERALIVGGGTGIASLYALAARAKAVGPVRVLLGARSADDLMGVDDFAELGVDLQPATEDGSLGHRGLVTDLLENELAQPDAAHVYACGPTPMMARCAEIARAAGVSCTVSLENGMACGFAVCLGCAVPVSEGGYALVCSDGPVFDAERVVWDDLP